MKICEKKNFTVLFNGDSITDGGRGHSMDCNHIMGHGYCEMAAADIGVKYLKSMPKFVNRGVGGQKLSQMAEKWQKDVLDIRPDVLSILIGANDYEDLDLASWEMQLSDLIETTMKEIPGIRIVLMEPFYIKNPPIDEPYKDVPHPLCEEYFDWVNFHLSEETLNHNMANCEKVQGAVKRIADKYGCTFVPLQKMLEDALVDMPLSYLIWDGVHPTFIGHRLIADQWLAYASDLFE